MSEHLSEQLIEQYHRRTLSLAELSAVDKHISMCPSCRQHFVSAADLVRLLTYFQSDHLTYEDLEDKIEGNLTGIEQARVDGHLEWCEECQSELMQVQAVAELPQKTYQPTPIWFNVLKRWWRQFLQLTDVNWEEIIRWKREVAIASAMILMAIGVYWFMRMTETDPNIAKATPSPSLAVNSSPSATPISTPNTRTETKESPLLAGLTNTPPEVQAALTKGKVTVPLNELEKLVVKDSTVLGGSVDKGAFKLVHPVAVVLETITPTLRWENVKDAEQYEIVIATQTGVIVEKAVITTTQWTCQKPLKRGVIYSWQVTTSIAGENALQQAKFKILDRASAQKIANVRKDYPNNRLVLRVFYAEAGLVKEAKEAFAQLIKEYQDNPEAKALAQKLLASISP